MSQTPYHEDLERVNNADNDQTLSTQPENKQSQPSGGESNFGDSSGPLFSIYSKAAEDEDNKMVESWQKDADGILFFTGLFSAAVAALLAVTVQDLRPNSQDTSAFHLGNIYQVLADPNATRSSTPSPVAKPPSFSPSRNAVWVNSFWFLSLVMSLSCALWATLLQQWARRYLRRAQLARRSPEKRARVRAFFAEGVDKMHVPWAVEGLPTLLHLSLFLFFGGLAIFLFDVDREVFNWVISWIGLFLAAYVLITLLPIIRHGSPYHSPLSTPAWFLYASILRLTFTFHAFTLPFFVHGSMLGYHGWRFVDMRDRYQRWVLGGVEKAAEELASERSSKIDVQILDWTISALGDGDDDSLKRLFEALPGFSDSEIVTFSSIDIPKELGRKFRDAMCGFLRRTWTSNSVDDSEKGRRVDISIKAINQISKNIDRSILPTILLNLNEDEAEVLQTIEMGHALAHWCKNDEGDISAPAQRIIVATLVGERERNDRWVTLAALVFGLPERDLWDNITLGGDSVLLAIFIHVTRQSLRSGGKPNLRILKILSKFDILNTHPRLQHDFCPLWNEIVQEGRNQGARSQPSFILNRIHLLYVALHQGTDAAPTAFSASTKWYDDILLEPSSYPFCNIANHHPHSTSHLSVHSLQLEPHNSSDASSHPPTHDANTTSRQSENVNTITEPSSSSNPTTTNEIGETSQGPNTIPLTNPAHPSPYPTDDSPTGFVAATTQTITSSATLSHPQERNEQQDIVAPCTGPDVSQILSTASTITPTPTRVPVPTSTPPVLDTLESCDSGAASASNSSLTEGDCRAGDHNRVV